VPGPKLSRRLRHYRATAFTVSHRIARSADVAQLVERRLPKPKVAGSSPVVRLRRELESSGTCLQMCEKEWAFLAEGWGTVASGF